MTTLEKELHEFSSFRTKTEVSTTSVTPADGKKLTTVTFTNEFWTSKQRSAHKLHEVPYRACFKAQLPRFFIERLTRPGDVVCDPFMGRGTTLVEAGLLGRVPYGCDANPLSMALSRPRLSPPTIAQVESRLGEIPFGLSALPCPADLLVFFEKDTLRQIAALRNYLKGRDDRRETDLVDGWIQMVATTRLTGHSPGFFSVYTLPPNQAVSVKSQIKINKRSGKKPLRKDVPALILRKSRALLKGLTDTDRKNLASVSASSKLAAADSTSKLPFASNSVDLVVTSPPFLDVVDYSSDNWLRNWFCRIGTIPKLAIHKTLPLWEAAMEQALGNIHAVLKPGGHVAFEVGEVRSKSVNLEEAALRAGHAAGLDPQLVLVNAQDFTKTSNIWGVKNGAKGTNTNRVVLFRKN